MKRKFLMLTLGALTFLAVSNVANAQEAFYTNKYGVSFSEQEYNVLSQFYWDGCQDQMTQQDYIAFAGSGMVDGEIATVRYIPPYEPPATRSSISRDKFKEIKLSKACTDDCLMVMTVTWTGIPTARSYDVLGAYLEGTSLKNTPTTNVKTSATTSSSYEIQKFSNGFGVSTKIPASGSNLIFSQTYRVSKSGEIYASYQHATSNISLADSKKYTISKTGYGHVFAFYGTAANIYDEAPGVSMALG